MKSILVGFVALAVSEISCFPVRPQRTKTFPSNQISLARVCSGQRCYTKYRRLPALGFSLKFNGGGDDKATLKKKTEKIDEEAEVDNGDDFSLWVEGLRQWPLYPSSPAESRRKETELDVPKPDLGRFRGVNQLSNFIKFEAILDLASVTNETEPYFSSIMAAADKFFKSVSAKAQEQEVENDTQDLSNVTTVEELIWLENIQKTIGGATYLNAPETRDSIARLSVTQTSAIASSNSTQAASLGKAAEALMKDATARIEFLVNEASTVLTPNSMQELVIRASKVFSSSSNGRSLEAVTNDIVQAAERVANEQGLDVQFVSDRARETTRYAANMVAIANGLFEAGYAYGSRSGVAGSEEQAPFRLNGLLTAQGNARPLFADYETARRIEPFQYEAVVAKGAEMGTLAGAIYEDSLEKCHKIGHTMVANGTTDDVAWMVTDSMSCESSFVEPDGDEKAEKIPILVRTITFRGFDASDETVDRERVLNIICTASEEPMNPATSKVMFHSGLLGTARKLYDELKKYIEWTSPNHRIVLNGHSIGGSLSILFLLLLTCDQGAEYARDRILRVFTHGSPPIAVIAKPPSGRQSKQKTDQTEEIGCPILEAFGLPSTMVYGYVQPYDPIVRFLTEYDALYPLVDDLGKDDVTLYSTGPRRSLRPIARAIFQSWEGWPQFRDSWKGTNQQYQSVGIQHLLLPEPLRYLNDRFVSTNIGVPPTEAIVRISSEELLPALNNTFPLDVFQISLIPQAVRSFLHHFYPAYDITIANYAAKVARQSRLTDKKKASKEASRTATSSTKVLIESSTI